MILNFYMKSGNVIRVDGVIKYRIENRENEIVSIMVEQRLHSKVDLAVKTVALDQIEGVTVEQEPADLSKVRRLYKRLLKGT